MNRSARPPGAARRCRALIAAALILVPAVLGCAQDAAPRRARVLVLVRSSSPVDNSALSALISDSMSMELQARDIDVLPSADLAADDAALGALKEQTQADFALSGVYAMSGSAIQLAVRWIDLADLREAGSASRTGELNLTFDALVASLIDELVEGQKEAIASLPPDAPAAEPPPPAQPEPVVQPEQVAKVEPAPAERIPEPVPRVVEVPAAAKEAKLAPFAFSVGSAPFIATFTALNYFPLGLAVSVNGRYQVRAMGGFLGFGFLTGLSGFHGRGEYAQADFYVVPLGADLLYGTLTGGQLDFFVHLGAGPAVLMAKPALSDLLAKVIPYATGGVGLTWSVLDVLAVALDASYTCFFDSSAAIMGFTPSLSAVLRL